ncbi:PEP-CTERM sorting domain-containing protein [Nitrosomonas ureae]|uniref:PEP-CTERM sorting domain-containing protein n=1 Tax=Nitrosomonas ureae TaxID=44577 RepID=UPI000BE3374B|nr:PEP-CTERM sorting domain-containing protein [Nitrosomonas ureae]
MSKAEADLQQANGLNYPNQFAIYTDDNGNVSDWSISVLNLLEENTSSNAHSVYYASYSDLSRSDYNDSFSLYNFTPTPELAALAYEPGTWSISSQMNNFAFTETFNYETPSPIPEPSTYLMLLAGLGLLGWKRFSA